MGAAPGFKRGEPTSEIQGRPVGVRRTAQGSAALARLVVKIAEVVELIFDQLAQCAFLAVALNVAPVPRRAAGRGRFVLGFDFRGIILPAFGGGVVVFELGVV